MCSRRRRRENIRRKEGKEKEEEKKKKKKRGTAPGRGRAPLAAAGARQRPAGDARHWRRLGRGSARAAAPAALGRGGLAAGMGQVARLGQRERE